MKGSKLNPCRHAGICLVLPILVFISHRYYIFSPTFWSLLLLGALGAFNGTQPESNIPASLSLTTFPKVLAPAVIHPLRPINAHAL